MSKIRKTILKNESGFSLVELMIVVGIIGLLATLAVPRFQQFQAKARMAEAKNMLNHIFTLEEAYHLDNNVYVNMALYGRGTNGTLTGCTNPPTGAVAIGFTISPCANAVPRYGYSVTGATNSTFTANAQTGAGNNNLVCPNQEAHEFRLDHNRTQVGPVQIGSTNRAQC